MKFLILVLFLGLTGCVSTEAAVLRAVTADRNAQAQKTQANELAGIAHYWHDKASKTEAQLLEQQLAELNYAAANPAISKEVAMDMVAKNYTRYFQLQARLGSIYAQEKAKIESKAAEVNARTDQFVAITLGADKELSVPAETAKLAFNAAFTTGLKLWEQYQAANPPVLPSDEPDPIESTTTSQYSQDQLDYWNDHGYPGGTQ